ncbi:HEAT repeat domain-containing protein [Halomicronema sp. CCY15110]|uniref:HEAT repeat domain-containing protein n=1 Tax=Halomicronema sp. CCY15110 TaxID=2767773 RepID=UPI00194E1641|nr:HEAT repeat domain-containing protein [Halomicronema sp. CCY15110]
MYEEDELKIIDPDAEFDDPLDQIAPAGEASEEPQVDPEEMLQLLNSPQAQQRMLAARAFCELEEPRAVPRLIELLQDSCPLVRVSAAYALGRNADETAIAPLIAQLYDWNGYVRKGVVWALGNSHTAEALQPLIEALKNDIPAVRLWAASALAQMINVNYETVVTALPPIIEVMRRDPIAAVRSNCAWAIGQLCRELPSNVVYATAIDALIETFAEEDDLGVREDARTAILNVGDPRGLQIIEELEQDGWF